MRNDLSQAELRVIRYLRGLTRANDWGEWPDGRASYPDRDSHVASSLARRGLVYYLRDENAWRLTGAGRNLPNFALLP